MMNVFLKAKIKAVLSGACLMSCFLFAPQVAGAAAGEIALPEPQVQNGMSVMQALAERKTSRSFADAEISPVQLSHILWAANGINRPESGGRTNPSAMGVHSVDVYAVTAEGIYLYRPQSHSLRLVAEGDYRMTTTTGQGFVGDAPLTLVYVADSSAWQNARRVPSEDMQSLYDGVVAGEMAQSVGLVAAAEGLGTCVRASIDHDAFSRVARLREGQTILLAQTLGVLP